MPLTINAIEIVQNHPLTVYVTAITVITFWRFGWDKYKARRGKWRTPEATLLSLCLLGGTLGGGLAIWLFRHKCSKASFMRAFYAIAVLQILVIIGVAYIKGRFI